MIASAHRRMNRLLLILGLTTAAAVAGSVTELAAQLVQPDVVTIPRGTSQLITLPANISRVSIGDPDIADAVVVSPREVLVNARVLGSTTLIVWDPNNVPRSFSIQVTVDAPSLERQLQALYPGQNIQVSASGSLVILSGSVTEAGIARRILEIAAGTGATIVDNLQVPPPQQILLNVRFAEVSRRALERIGADFAVGRTTATLSPLAPASGDVVGALTDGLVELFLFDSDIQLAAVVDALSRIGTFRSLAEPNLLALEGREASFLAGGEFPYPVPQAGAGGQSTITVEFKEFGVRLRFVPTVTLAGNIRLEVSPEVSSLDFAGGVQFSGFNVPALLTRRAETEVELRDGQTLAIAGLMDNTSQRTVSRVPILGDLPFIGLLFRRREVQQNQTELLVLVTPRIVQPSDVSPQVPTGEPETWEWHRDLRRQ
jgi:pilus assembly protein CpaC